jgi:hypothetical protein
MAMGMFGIAILAVCFAWASPVMAGDETETGELLISLLKAGRAVVSENQGLINDPSKGNKGLRDSPKTSSHSMRWRNSRPKQKSTS